jgi:hypothetical protein
MFGYSRPMTAFVLLCGVLCGTLAAAEKKGGNDFTATDLEKAGPDFKVQGEYAGAKLGAQVVAHSEGHFLAVFFPGGLPGDGWDGQGRFESSGKTEGEKTTFAPSGGKGYAAVITGETMTGQTDAGEKFELKRVVRHSLTEGAKPPAGTEVLGADAFESGLVDTRGWWVSSLNGLEPEFAPKGKGNPNLATKKLFQSFTLHVEFMIPYKPVARGQARANSGVYIQRRYEVQILDSFGTTAKTAVGDICGEMYKQVLPKLNMCYPPLSWQTYDIDFQAAKFDAAGKKTQNAVITVRLNGVVIHDKLEVVSKTGAGQAEGPKPGPIYLQEHGNPVLFRNMWVVEKP